MNWVSKKSLSRRTLLRGIGCSIGLPLLDAMVPAFARAASLSAPLRVGYFYFPHGVNPALFSWTPNGTGAGFQFPTGLANTNLVKHRSDLLVVGGLVNKWGYYNSYGDSDNDHACAIACYLTGARPNQSRDNVFYSLSTKQRNSGALPVADGMKSVDVHIMEKIGAQQRVPILHITRPGNARFVADIPYSLTYQSNLSWRSATAPSARYNSPSKVFSALFGTGSGTGTGGAGGSGGGTGSEMTASQRSILDLVLGEAKSLEGKLGASDKIKLDEYLTSVRAVEKSLQAKQDVPPAASCNPGSSPSDSMALDAMTKTYLDLIALAFQCDQSRVAAYMLDYELNDSRYAFAGANKYDGHQASHGNFSEDYGDAIKIVTWYANQFEYLISKLKSMPEGSGTVLSNSILHLGSGTNTARGDHPDNELPMVVAGQGGGLLQTGRAIYTADTRLSNYHLALLNKLGINLNSFGDSTGPMPGL